MPEDDLIVASPNAAPVYSSLLHFNDEDQHGVDAYAMPYWARKQE